MWNMFHQMFRVLKLNELKQLCMNKKKDVQTDNLFIKYMVYFIGIIYSACIFIKQTTTILFRDERDLQNFPIFDMPAYLFYVPCIHHTSTCLFAFLSSFLFVIFLFFFIFIYFCLLTELEGTKQNKKLIQKQRRQTTCIIVFIPSTIVANWIVARCIFSMRSRKREDESMKKKINTAETSYG